MRDSDLTDARTAPLETLLGDYVAALERLEAMSWRNHPDRPRPGVSERAWMAAANAASDAWNKVVVRSIAEGLELREEWHMAAQDDIESALVEAAGEWI